MGRLTKLVIVVGKPVGMSVLRGGPGSGNFDHSGRPGEVGGSGSSTNQFKVSSMKDVSTTPLTGARSAWLSPNGDLYNVSGTEESHLKFANKHLGYNLKNDSSYVTPVLKDGYVRVVAGKYETWIQTETADNVTFKFLQDHIGNLVLSSTERITWEPSSGNVNSLNATVEEFLDANKFNIKDGYIILRDFKSRGGEGSGNFGHEGRPGQVGGSGSSNTSPTTSLKDELSSLQEKTKHGGTSEELAREKELVALIRHEKSKDVKAQSFGKKVTGADGQDDESTWKLDWKYTSSPYEPNETPEWAQKTRNMYVVDDAKTLARNRDLREGKEPQPFTMKMDRLTYSGTFTEPTMLYRGAYFRPEQIDAIAEAGEFTDKAYMSTSPYASGALGYAQFRAQKEPLEGHQVVLFHLRVPEGSHFGHMDPSEYVLPRGRTVKITGLERPKEPGSEWNIYGEVE